MKFLKFLFAFVVLLLVPVFVLTAQTLPEPIIELPTTYEGLEDAFSTFAKLVLLIPLVVELLKTILFNLTDRHWFGDDFKKHWTLLFSWGVGILVTLGGWFLGLGFLEGISIWMAILYGFGAVLCANGVADTQIVQFIFSFLKKR